MFFPYSTERDLQRIPYATITLIVLNVLFAAITWANEQLFSVLVLNPSDFGWWQPISHLFVHAGIFHLAGNMIFLWVFGAHVEDTIGIPKYLLLYASAGLAAAGLQAVSGLIFHGQMLPMVGASGSVMGLVALFATRFRKIRINFVYFFGYGFRFACGTSDVAAIWMALGYIAFDLILGVGFGAAGIANRTAHFAHIGGFITGLVWAYALHLPKEAHTEDVDGEIRQWIAAGAYETAALTAEKELIKQPDDPDMHCYAARSLEMKPRTAERAIPHWNEALRLWLHQGRIEEAFEHWDKLVVRYKPHEFDPEIMCDLAVARENAGELQGAADIYNAIAQHHPSSRPAPLAALRLAQLLARLGQTEAARQWYDHVIHSWPDRQESLRASAELRGLGRD